MESRVANLGDNVQYWGILELYRQIGVPEADIHRISIYDLPFYEGDDLLVPMNSFFYDEYCTMFPPSPDIYPLFFGFHASPPEQSRLFDYIDYYKLFEPVGCRDHATCEALRRRGVEAYVTGCASLALPRRPEGTYEKIFLVDLRPDLEKYLPRFLTEVAERVNHLVPIMEYPMSPAEVQRIDDIAQKTFARYREEAALVITNRLHAALPCCAMGIPTILGAGSATSIDDTHRYSWVYEIVPPSRSEDLARLSLPPPPTQPQYVDFIENKKMEMRENFAKAVNQAVEKHKRDFAASRSIILKAHEKFQRHYRDDVHKVLFQCQNFAKQHMADSVALKCSEQRLEQLSRSRWRKLGRKLGIVKSLPWET